MTGLMRMWGHCDGRKILVVHKASLCRYDYLTQQAMWTWEMQLWYG